MKLKTINIPVENPNHIEGIYNYCDRWCEKCPYTNRCLNFEISEEKFGDPESRDVNNKKFWETLTKVFDETREMIENIAREEGIDLANLKPDPELEKQLKEQDEKIENHELSIASREYGNQVHKWFKNENDIFKVKGKELAQNFTMGITDEKLVKKQIKTLEEDVEIIQWYQHFIHVKLMRSLLNNDDIFNSEGEDNYPKDSDGSAKVALIAIERSIAAWAKMQQHFPDKADDILDFLVSLDRLRRKVDLEFPNARKFVRPGFDTL